MIKNSNDEILNNYDFLSEFVQLIDTITCHINQENLEKSKDNIINNDKDEKNIKSRIYDEGKYFGDFKDNKREGKGTMYYNNGDKYEGFWENDRMEGKGTMYYNNGDIYEGEWEKDIMNGRGIYFYHNNIEFDKYEGEFNNGDMEGDGTLYYTNGDIFVGYFFKNNKIGEGKMYYNNGDIYEGNYINNMKDGKVFIIILMAINTKANFSMIKKKEEV